MDGTLITKNNIRPCLHCHLKPIKGKYDACIGKLPGVKHACCGHGKKEGYISFNNNVTLYFNTNEIIKFIKDNKDITIGEEYSINFRK